MSFDILLGDNARDYLSALDEKSQRIVKENLRNLQDDPYPRPGAGSGDQEQLVVDGEELYQLHIGRTHTAFYEILEDESEVRVIEIMDIDDAHSRYGFDYAVAHQRVHEYSVRLSRWCYSSRLSAARFCSESMYSRTRSSGRSKARAPHVTDIIDWGARYVIT